MPVKGSLEEAADMKECFNTGGTKEVRRGHGEGEKERFLASRTALGMTSKFQALRTWGAAVLRPYECPRWRRKLAGACLRQGKQAVSEAEDFAGGDHQA